MPAHDVFPLIAAELEKVTGEKYGHTAQTEATSQPVQRSLTAFHFSLPVNCDKSPVLMALFTPRNARTKRSALFPATKSILCEIFHWEGAELLVITRDPITALPTSRRHIEVQ